MSVQMRIPTQQEMDDGLSFLKNISHIIMNPQVIADAEEMKRKQAQLTADELSKLDEARKLIAEYDTKVKDLQNQKEELQNVKDDHAVMAKKYSESVEADTKRFNEWEERLKKGEEDLLSEKEKHKKEIEGIVASRKDADDYAAGVKANADAIKAEAQRHLDNAKAASDNAIILKQELETRIAKMKSVLNDEEINLHPVKMPFGM